MELCTSETLLVRSLNMFFGMNPILRAERLNEPSTWRHLVMVLVGTVREYGSTEGGQTLICIGVKTTVGEGGDWSITTILPPAGIGSSERN